MSHSLAHSVQHVKYHIIAKFASVVQPRPTLGIILSLVGGALTLSLAALIASMNLTVALANPLFDFTLVVGLVICSGGSLLYFRPRRHSAWGAIILIASLVDLTGSFYFLYSPFNGTANLFTLFASVGPLVGLAGSLAGINWKSPHQTPNQQLPPT